MDRIVTTMLECENLSRFYGQATALDSLDLTITAGECVALMGPNGSGKTTAAELICGLQEPSSGWVEVAGFSIHREPDAIAARRHLSYVPDNPALYQDLTVYDHLQLVAAAHGVADDDLDEVRDTLLRSLGLDKRVDYFPSQLSRGMRQKTAIACAVIRPFSLLVLDEPTIGLDAASITALHDLVAEAMEDRRAILLMTHDQEFALSLATRVLHISEGHVSDA